MYQISALVDVNPAAMTPAIRRQVFKVSRCVVPRSRSTSAISVIFSLAAILSDMICSSPRWDAIWALGE